MELENTFEVTADSARVWDFLLNIEGIVQCIPGAELTEVVDDSTWKGRMRVKLGPVSMTYNGEVVMEECDEEARKVVLRANGKESAGRGSASAIVMSRLEPAGGGGTRVIILNNLTLSGPVAQFGRGMIDDVSKRLTNEFAECLRQRITASESVEAPSAKSQEVAGLRLALWTLWRALLRRLKRIWGALTVRGSAD